MTFHSVNLIVQDLGLVPEVQGFKDLGLVPEVQGR